MNSNIKFEEWRRESPTKKFKDFVAERVEGKVRRGERHGTLGGNLRGDKYGVSGEAFFWRLVELGLKPGDTCVDYGCGTLRLGIHTINYLRPGAYWGMDISPFLLEEGRRLIGDLWKEKQPRLRVISSETIAEAAATKPAMLFSARVLAHVHPDELLEYFQNILKIIGASGQAIIEGKWSDTETIHKKEISWAHALSTIRDIVEAQGGSVEIIRQSKPKTARHGILRIRHTVHVFG